MVDKIHNFRPMFLIIVIPVLFSCATTQQAPDETRLRLRFQDANTAMWSGDARTLYEMTTPSLRTEKYLEDIKKDMKEIDKKSTQPGLRAGLEKICDCRVISGKTGERLRCVLLVSITKDKPRGLQVRGLEIWEYLDREWYFMGAVEGETCPRH